MRGNSQSEDRKLLQAEWDGDSAGTKSPEPSMSHDL